MVGKWSEKCKVEISQKLISAVLIFNGFNNCKHILRPNFIFYFKHQTFHIILLKNPHVEKVSNMPNHQYLNLFQH